MLSEPRTSAAADKKPPQSPPAQSAAERPPTLAAAPKPPMAAAAVEVVGASKKFGGVVALDGVRLRIGHNEFFTLLGPSGCGKTTMLRIIAGFEEADRGDVMLFGERINHLPPHRRSVNTVFQSYALFPHMSALENVKFGLRMQKVADGAATARAEEMLAMVKLSEFGGRRPGQLSGGQRQRVALARALAPAPRVLLLDESLSALDLKLRQAMRVELKQIQRDTGITFVFVTHDQDEALTMSDRVAVMSRGSLRQVGTPREIYETPRDKFVADFIGDVNLLAGEIAREGDDIFFVLAGGERIALTAADIADIGGGSSGEDDNLRRGVQSGLSAAIRPEKSRLVGVECGGMRGVVERSVYIGAVTETWVLLEGGARFMTRSQNLSPTAAPPLPGAQVGVQIEPGAARLLWD